jgi:5-methylcytosine-specific restriction endonuclease McrA
VRALIASWAATNPEKRRALNEAWRKTHPEEVRAKNIAWRKANPEKARAAVIAWNKAHPEERAVIAENRRARTLSAEGRHTAEEVKKLLARQKYRCAICKGGLEAGYHRDHIVPLFLGGSNWIRNLQLLCPKCNLKKGSKHPIRFMQEMGYLLQGGKGNGN